MAEDATGQQGKINVWQDDMTRWESEFSIGNLLRLRLQPPSGGFPTYLLESNNSDKYRYQKRYVDKDADPRVFVMRKAADERDCLTDEEALEVFSTCTMDI